MRTTSLPEMSSVLIILIVLATISIHLTNGSGLKLAQILCRHGDRTPTEDYREWYPTDPYINENYLPPGFGELTNTGRNHSFQLGEFIRDKYSAILNTTKDYASDSFKVRSSEVRRCQESAKILLSAIFPEVESIPIYYKKLRKDPLFLGTYICPRVGAEMTRAQRSMRRLENEDRWVSLYEYLSQHLGVNATRHHAFTLLHTLMAQSSFGLPLPNWTKKIYPSEELEINAVYEYISQSYNTKLKRVNGGLWIREFIKNIENSINGTDSTKIFLYVGHDVNIAGFLNALDIPQPRVPSFCSCINLELYEGPTKDDHYVKLFYRNYDKIEEQQIPRCSSSCSLKDFKYLTKHLITGDVKKDCGL